MNSDLRARHMVYIVADDAVDIYDRLCALCDERPDGGITDADQQLIADYAEMEQNKALLRADVAERGVMVLGRNGRQSYWQENKSVQQIRMTVEQQRKLLNELRLTPASRKARAMNIGDEFDDFD